VTSGAPSPAAPRILACGDAAISVEFGDGIDPALNARVLALDSALASDPVAGVVETVPTYRSLLVHFDPLETDVPMLLARIDAACRRVAPPRRDVRRWRVPVVYGGAFGMDLDDLAARHGLSAQELVARHAGRVYQVYMIGFMPGFAYLGGLDPALATPRRVEPRMETPAQSISIGGAQTAISSVAGPSGWHMIGRTPARGFMPGRDPVFLYEAGDEIVFEPIPEGDWARMDAAAARGEPVATSVLR
jgi:KipI family sensor histidine kinase inhibitor